MGRSGYRNRSRSIKYVETVNKVEIRQNVDHAKIHFRLSWISSSLQKWPLHGGAQSGRPKKKWFVLMPVLRRPGQSSSCAQMLFFGFSSDSNIEFDFSPSKPQISAFWLVFGSIYFGSLLQSNGHWSADIVPFRLLKHVLYLIMTQNDNDLL